jgi:hypothetical protein
MKFGHNVPHQVAGDDSDHAYHHSGIDPVVEMRAPADNEFRQARVRPRLFVIEKRLFGEVIRTAGAGIKLRHLCIANGGGKAQQGRKYDADPHCRSGRAGGCLAGKCEPKKGAGCNQRHGVHGQTGQAQRFFHLNGFISHGLLLRSDLLGHRRPLARSDSSSNWCGHGLSTLVTRGGLCCAKPSAHITVAPFRHCLKIAYLASALLNA